MAERIGWRALRNTLREEAPLWAETLPRLPNLVYSLVEQAQRPALPPPPPRRRLPGRLELVLGGAGLFFVGFLNGSLTSGTGLFCTLWLVRWFGLDYRRAVAYTLVLVGLFWNGAGAVTLVWLGEVKWSWLPALLAGSLVGGYLGAHWAIVKGNLWIKRAFEIVTVLVGLKLVF